MSAGAGRRRQAECRRRGGHVQHAFGSLDAQQVLAIPLEREQRHVPRHLE